VANVKTAVFWNGTPCRVVESCSCFGGTHRLRLQGRGISLVQIKMIATGKKKNEPMSESRYVSLGVELHLGFMTRF
jgi:hypothetical protein